MLNNLVVYSRPATNDYVCDGGLWRNMRDIECYRDKLFRNKAIVIEPISPENDASFSAMLKGGAISYCDHGTF